MMVEILICALTGIFSIICLYIGAHLKKRDTNKNIIEKRFELYKPLYFQLCVRKCDLKSAIQEMITLNNRINNNMNDYLLLDSKTRRYLSNVCRKTDIIIWNKETFFKETNNLSKAIEQEFIKIQNTLGYPVSPTKHLIANISFGGASASLYYICIAIFINMDKDFKISSILFAFLIFAIALYALIKNIHYLGNY